MNKKNRAFTLVELIVVITIIAILGTIAFISLQGYSKTARDSRRISDVSNIKTALELFILNTGKYPLPDNSEEVSYSGDLLWTQGTVGDNVTANLSKTLQKKPLDPLLDIEYTYSTTNSKKEYQVMALYEGELSQTNDLINTSYAANNYNIKVEGTYNEVFVKADHFIVPTPSIINSEVDGSGITLNENNILSQVTTGGTNFPKLNIPNTTVQTRGLEINLSVYTGSITKDSTSQDKINVITAIQTAYTGSMQLASKTIYKNILSTPEPEILVNQLILKNYNTSTPKIPIGSRIVMESCPVGWNNVGTLITLTGRPTYYSYCNGDTCKICESTGVDIKIGDKLVMESCPVGWNNVGTVISSTGRPVIYSDCNGSTCKICESTGISIKTGDKIIMESCPVGWNDVGTVENGPDRSYLSSDCNGGTCEICNAN